METLDGALLPRWLGLGGAERHAAAWSAVCRELPPKPCAVVSGKPVTSRVEIQPPALASVVGVGAKQRGDPSPLHGVRECRRDQPPPRRAGRAAGATARAEGDRSTGDGPLSFCPAISSGPGDQAVELGHDATERRNCLVRAVQDGQGMHRGWQCRRSGPVVRRS
jgi:hypothetical protein